MPGFTLSRRQALVVVVCALGAVLLASRLLGSPPSHERPLSPPLAAPAESATTTPAVAVVVDVAGAVHHPGVYRLKPGARVADAITKAGGPTRKADPSQVNLAAPLIDGQQVLMPARGAAGPGALAAPTTAEAPISLSLATVEQLDALPGVGPMTAQKIVEYRREHGPFTSIDQLDAIAGIGPTRIDNLRGLVVP